MFVLKYRYQVLDQSKSPAFTKNNQMKRKLNRVTHNKRSMTNTNKDSRGQRNVKHIRRFRHFFDSKPSVMMRRFLLSFLFCQHLSFVCRRNWRQLITTKLDTKTIEFIVSMSKATVNTNKKCMSFSLISHCNIIIMIRKLLNFNKNKVNF